MKKFETIQAIEKTLEPKVFDLINQPGFSWRAVFDPGSSEYKRLTSDERKLILRELLKSNLHAFTFFAEYNLFLKANNHDKVYLETPAHLFDLFRELLPEDECFE